MNDIYPMLSAENSHSYDIESAFAFMADSFVSLMAGDAWKGIPEKAKIIN